MHGNQIRLFLSDVFTRQAHPSQEPGYLWAAEIGPDANGRTLSALGVMPGQALVSLGVMLIQGAKYELDTTIRKEPNAPRT